MRRHDEPNEYGFAGGATAPEPPSGARADEKDRMEQIAVPGDDLTEVITDAMEETEEERSAEGRR